MTTSKEGNPVGISFWKAQADCQQQTETMDSRHKYACLRGTMVHVPVIVISPSDRRLEEPAGGWRWWSGNTFKVGCRDCRDREKGDGGSTSPVGGSKRATGWRSRWTQKRRSTGRTPEGEVSRVSFPELLYNFVLNSTPD